MLRKIWDSRLPIFMLIFLLYSIPFMTSSMSGPGPFDFLWEDWGWSIGYYVVGELILILIVGVLALTGHFELKAENDNAH